jgi:hypothetical protein
MNRVIYYLLILAGALLLAASQSGHYSNVQAGAGEDARAQAAAGFGPGSKGALDRGNPSAAGGVGAVVEGRKLIDRFDQDRDGRLNAAERQAAREFLARERASGAGGSLSRSGGAAPVSRPKKVEMPPPGPKLTPADVQNCGPAPLYASNVLRTIFLEFENPNWETELADFKGSDVLLPARVTVDGRIYPDVGVHFRGTSSYATVGAGRKRSLTLAMDFVHGDQRLHGCSTLHLLNASGDPTLLRTVLFLHVARQYIPAPKANLVRVAINGESWGIYVNQQAFNKEFVKDWFSTAKGARWKVPGSPDGQAGLAYLGDDVKPYQKLYEIKTKHEPRSWGALANLCRALAQTPPARLEDALAPLLDIEGALKFLALDNVFINNDGYWARASDYGLYLDVDGRFHFIPHDVNETFRIPESPNPSLLQAVRGLELDPLAGCGSTNKALLNKMLACRPLRERYLRLVREISIQSLDWRKLGPLARQYQELIAADVKTDTRKLDTYEAFLKGLTEDRLEQGLQGPVLGICLKNFVEQRRSYLDNYLSLKTVDNR